MVDEERFTEIWNLVFMQNIQDEPYHVIGDLPAKNIDTGAGLERVAMVLQQKDTVFEIDTLVPIREAGERYVDRRYGDDEQVDVSLRILADHGRAMTFLISDGVVPSNEGRGYVLRRLIRRAVRRAWTLGGSEPVTRVLIEATIEMMKDAYPELHRADAITSSIRPVARRRASDGPWKPVSPCWMRSSTRCRMSCPGRSPSSCTTRTASRLRSPPRLPRSGASPSTGRASTPRWMSSATRLARPGRGRGRPPRPRSTARCSTGLISPTSSDTSSRTSQSRVVALLRDGEAVESLAEGEEGEVFLDRTPFYAEAGGQVGDSGTVWTETGSAVVTDTQFAIQGINSHRVKVAKGTIRLDQEATAEIDRTRRERIRKSHTGTHILHSALRSVLGDHARQAGSLVEAGRLRFDFSHHAAVDPEELAAVEALANDHVIENARVTSFETSKQEAEAMGAIAFFGDKYGETVRVVEAGSFSRELCGGTHTATTGQVGPLIVTSEGSIGSNMRRVEALTGSAAYHHIVGSGLSWRVPPPPFKPGSATSARR